VSASTENIISDLVGKLVPLVRQGIPELRALYVFGSAADGRLRGDSDIDLAVLAAGRVESEILFSAAQACSLLVGREVELVDLRAVPVVFQAQIVGRGRRLEVPYGDHEADFFENQVLSRYTVFVEERRPVVSEILKRRRFRNLAVHNYRKLDLAIVQNLVEHRLGDFARFCAIAIGS